MKKAKKRVFSIVKAVKANARARVGIVPTGKVIPDPKQKAGNRPKHKQTLQALLESSLPEAGLPENPKAEDRAQ